jgi:hypothetical protein
MPFVAVRDGAEYAVVVVTEGQIYVFDDVQFPLRVLSG